MTSHSRRQFLGVTAFGLMSGAGLSPARAQAAVSAPLPVIASFSILADLIRQVGGDRLSITTLVGAGDDAHVYTPSPADGRALAVARLVVINGLGFEGWVNRLIRSSGTKAGVITATRGVKPITGKADGHSHGHDHGDDDPHAWQSVANAKIYIANLRDALVEASPADADLFRARADGYLGQLDALDAGIRAAIAAIPPDRRKIITSHDAFGYFEAAYGLKFVSPRGVSTSAEPSAQAVGRIIRQIRAEKIQAVFLENLSDQRLMRRIAEETGARIGGTLYSDALSPPDGPAPTYLAMMRHNLGQFTSALATA